jgi:dipeptidase E
MPRLLLLSNGINPGSTYLAHALDPIRALLGRAVREVLFVPYAAVERSMAEYREIVSRSFEGIGYQVASVADATDPRAAVEHAEAVVVGGGNTFQLLARCGETGILPGIRARVREGMPYIGWSAGSNLACPTIRTTNDMPIVEPPGLTALGLIPFQINPHYTDFVQPDHEGETRDDRLREFLVLNPRVRVVGLREGSMLRIEGREVALLGPHPLRLFEADRPPRDLAPGDPLLSALLGTGSPGDA